MSTGEAYLRHITAGAADRNARSAFLRLVLGAAGPGARIFDFGAGPGIDAKFYAQHGHRVAAYDADPRMRESFLELCRNEVELGQVALFQGVYRDFLESPPAGPYADVDIVTANFAPLNLIDELTELFGKFHSMTKPRATVVASVLNPYFVGDARYRWWWKHAPALLMHGHFSVAGEQGPIHRRLPRYIAAAALPYFRLKSVMRGLPGNTCPRWPIRHLCLSTSRYLFLEFIKC